MLSTAIYVQKVSLENRLSVWSIIGLRVGFTIYSGWLTVATILNIAFVLKYSGLSNAAAGIDESWWAVGTLIAVFGVYVFVSYMLKNPLYSCVGVWVLIAIRDKQAAYSNIETTATTLLIALACYIVGITVWLVLDKIK